MQNRIGNGRRIGQIIFTANNLDPQAGTWELAITWAQPEKNLDSLVGLAPEYTKIPFMEARVSHDSQHGVKFEKTQVSIGLEDGHEYAALISLDNHQDAVPFILSVATLSSFNRVRDQKKVKHEVLKVPEGIFKVKVLGHTVSGTLQKIMNHFTTEWACDPTETLQGSEVEWEKKAGMKYLSQLTSPPLPPVNSMLLQAAVKAAQRPKDDKAA